MTAEARFTRRPRRRAVKPIGNATDWRRRPEPLRPTWEGRSACYNRPAEWWDTDGTVSAGKARQVCVGCPVLAECLGAAMGGEASTMWNRTQVRGGLSGEERTQLFLDRRREGPYDAEEARLLALEAMDAGVAVEQLAEGVSGSTVRLARRLAGERVERVPIPKAVELRGGTALERAFSRAEDIMRWRDEEGLSQQQVASRLGIGRTSVAAVVKACEDMAQDASVKAVAA